MPFVSSRHKVDFKELNPYDDTGLRLYQIENKAKIYKFWKTGRSVMLQMPTGTGKTRLFVSIVKDLHIWGAKHRTAVKVLLLAHRKELIDQIGNNLGIKYGLAHGYIASQNVERKQYPIQVGSVPTLNRRLDNWTDKNFDVIIIDEAHHVKAESYRRIIQEFPNAKILGVTATPYRLNGAGFKDIFEDLIISDSVASFIKKGYLSEYEYYSIAPSSKTQKDIEGISKFALDGDYLDSEMMAIMDTDKIRANVVKTYLSYANDKKGLVYTINKTHNEHICQQFIDNGIEARAIDSDTDASTRAEIVEQFKQGKFKVLCNVNIFSEGFDCPDVEFIQLARPTKSLSMFLQQIGRGLRRTEDKQKVIFLDNVGLYNRFGLPSARRMWRKHFEGQDVDENELKGTTEKDVQVHFIEDFEEGNEQVALIHSSLQENEIREDENIMEENKNYKHEFSEFMRQSGLSSGAASSYLSAIENYVDSYIKEYVDNKHTTLYRIIDVAIIENIQNKLNANIFFKSINAQKHNRFSAALGKYVAFAKSFAVKNVFIEKRENSSFQKDKERLNEIDKEIQVFNKYGAKIPDSLVMEKEELENRYWREKMSVEIADMLNAKYRNLGCKISLCINYSDEDGWRVVTEK